MKENELSFEEVAEVLAAIPDIDFTKLAPVDCATYILACKEFAERMKPLVIKSKLKEEKPTSFLFRMD